MKNILKYVLFFSLSLTIACGNSTSTSQEKKETAEASMSKEMPTHATDDSMEDKMKDKMADMKEGMDEMKDEMKDKMADVKEGMDDMKDEMKDMKDDMKKAVTEKAGAVKEATKDVMEKTTESVTTAAAATKATATATKEAMVDKVAEVTKTVENTKVAAKEEMKDKMEDGKKETTTAAVPVAKKETPKPVAFSHNAWNTLAQKHISASGKVNYKGFKADKAAFDAYLKSLADNPIQSSWSRAKKMAYWINAYNAFTIKLIVDNYPIKSITDLDGGKPWDRKWIKLGGKTYSLNNIEHDILRPQYKDARIHFAVNCAAKSCPPVWNKAWTAANLNGQLERSAKAFINNAKYNDVGGSNAAISKIFEWYAVDFGDITSYLNKYASTKVDAGTTVSYKEYNWALNE